METGEYKTAKTRAESELVWAQMPYEKGEADGSKEIKEEAK